MKEKNKNAALEAIPGTSESRDQYRVVIGPDANKSLEEMVWKVNLGFDGGSVTKSDVANYIFLNLSKLISESDIRNIKSIHFDEKKVLGSLLRGEHDLPEDLRKAIRAHFGLNEKEKKKAVRGASDLSTEGNVDNAEVA